MQNNPVLCSGVPAGVVLLLLALAACGGRSQQVIQTDDYRIRVDTVSAGLEHPWGMTFLPGGEILVTERPGRLRIIEEGQLLPEPVGGLPAITERGQGGLMDVALHPDFMRNRWVYLSFAAVDDGGYGTEVLRGRLRDRELQDVEIIFKAVPKANGGRHFGSRLLFAPDGSLYITLGERGQRQLAQDLESHLGSLIRLNDDGSVPEDNPFTGQTGSRPEIFSYGHRNIQGIDLQPATGRLWIHEHGPQGGDELNIVEPGENYGWPVITYGVNYGTGTRIGEGTHKPGMRQPVHYWVPSIAPSGMVFYQGDEFPAWQGDLFIGSLKFGELVRLDVEGREIRSEQRLSDGALGRVRDVRQGPDGRLYLLIDAPNGRLLRLQRSE